MAPEYKRLDARGPQNGQLPPHDAVAEAAVLGCVLVENGCLARMRERFQGRGQAFFVQAHQVVLRAMSELAAERQPIDVITVRAKLGPDRLMSCGGLAWLAGLPDKANPPALDSYLEIVWEKYLARLKLQEAYELERAIREKGGLNEADIARFDDLHAEWKRLSTAAGVQPQLLAEPKEFYEDYLREWYRLKGEEPGWKLPVPLADLRIRGHELTVFTAENGAGKSTYLGQLAVALGQQGAKVVIASLEEHVPQTLHMLSRQLIGAATDRLEQSTESARLLANAMAWMQARFRFYNFLGIGNWREILDCFRYARAVLGYEVFILDSFMKVGVPDDDYAGQSVAANAFSDWCLVSGAHVVLVVHQNKAEGGATQVKRKVRGAGTITDAAMVIMGIRRNEKKEAKLSDLWTQQESDQRIVNNQRALESHRQAAEERIGGYRAERAKLKQEWDSEVRLLKQRRKGTQQNASRKLWFDRMSLQFRGHPEDSATNYLAATSVAAIAAPGGAAEEEGETT